MIELRHLEMLLAVAERGSFTAAGHALRITPSAVSQQMSALERMAGSVLFERSTRGVTLTRAGRLLATAAQSIHGELARTRQSLAALETGTPTLTIASFTSAGERILAPALADLSERYGQPVDVTVLEAEPDDAIKAVRDGRADLAITYRLGDTAPPEVGLRYRPLVTDALRLVVPARSPLGQRRKVAWSDLVGESWICGWGGLGDIFDRFAREHGLEPQVACRSSDYDFMQALTGAGVGLALIPELALTSRHDTTALMISPTANRHIGVHAAPRLGPDHPAHALEALLHERARPAL